MSSEAVTAGTQHHTLPLLSFSWVLPTGIGIWATEQPLLQPLVQATTCGPQQVGAVSAILGTYSHRFRCSPDSLLDPRKDNPLRTHKSGILISSLVSFSPAHFPLTLCAVPCKTGVLWGFCIACASQGNTCCFACGSSVHTCAHTEFTVQLIPYNYLNKFNS